MPLLAHLLAQQYGSAPTVVWPDATGNPGNGPGGKAKKKKILRRVDPLLSEAWSFAPFTMTAADNT